MGERRGEDEKTTKGRTGGETQQTHTCIVPIFIFMHMGKWLKPPRRNVAMPTEQADDLSVTSAKLCLLFTFTQDTSATRLHTSPSHLFQFQETVQKYITVVCYILFFLLLLLCYRAKKRVHRKKLQCCSWVVSISCVTKCLELGKFHFHFCVGFAFPFTQVFLISQRQFCMSLGYAVERK